MHRAASRRIHLNAVSKTAVIAAGGAATFGFTAWALRRPAYADNGEDKKQWAARPTADSHNRSATERAVRQARLDGRKQQTPSPPPQTKGHHVYDDKEVADISASAWETATNQLTQVRDGFTSFDYTSIRDKITDYVLPGWLKGLPALITKLQNELSMAPWSLSWEIWEDAHDPEINPEIIWDAKVRISNDLCLEEQQFLEKRRPKVAKALAQYLGIPEDEVHPDDVPVIAMCGSGGGLRALVAGTSSYLSAQQDGLFDCATYTAGVSGSCWLQALYYSSIGKTDFGRLAEHYKSRLGVHIAFPPAALGLLSQAPTNKFLLSGSIEKLKGVPDAEFGLVDIYGMLLAARLMVPKGELSVTDWDLKISNQRYFVDYGDQPLPIYTAVRHEVPEVEHDKRESSQEVKTRAEKAAWFQWFEWTPYEFFCEELSAGIPTWAVGRPFDSGHTTWRENGLALPEIRLPLMLGIWGSAFCATLSHYYREIQPILKGSGIGVSLDQLLTERDEAMVKMHPFDPASIPNFALGLRGRLPPTCPESIHSATHLRLMDAGMSNNLPIYPLLRPGRDVDVIVAFDVSADAPMDNWIKVASGYAKQRRIKGWPMNAGWPPRSNEEEQTIKELDEAQAASEGAPRLQHQEEDLGHCTVWVGSTVERDTDVEPPPSNRVRFDDDAHHIKHADAGMAVIYFPLIPNEKVPGVDPQKSDFMSTWNFVYTPEEIDSVVALAKANFEEGKEQVKRTVKAVWERKRDRRLEKLREAKDERRKARLRRGEYLGKKGEGDHFS